MFDAVGWWGPGGIANTYNHLEMSATTNEGYHNLAKLTSIGYTQRFYHRPRIDKDTVSKRYTPRPTPLNGGSRPETSCRSTARVVGFMARIVKTRPHRFT